jgi:hypothetical protein
MSAPWLSHTQPLADPTAPSPPPRRRSSWPAPPGKAQVAGEIEARLQLYRGGYVYRRSVSIPSSHNPRRKALAREFETGRPGAIVRGREPVQFLKVATEEQTASTSRWIAEATTEELLCELMLEAKGRIGLHRNIRHGFRCLLTGHVPLVIISLRHDFLAAQLQLFAYAGTGGERAELREHPMAGRKVAAANRGRGFALK